DNPRTASMTDVALRSLRSRIPEMRAEAQILLRRIRLHGDVGTSGIQSAQKGRSRMPLGPGVYAELELRVPRIGWRGITDLLILSDDSCEIVDFKIGAPDEEHRFQLRVYALLWSRDSELNPTGRLVDKLTLSYSGGDVRIDPPTSADLDALENELVRRRCGA